MDPHAGRGMLVTKSRNERTLQCWKQALEASSPSEDQLGVRWCCPTGEDLCQARACCSQRENCGVSVPLPGWN